MPKKRFLSSYAVYDLMVIAMLGALGIAFKTIAGILVRMITGPLGIPGGALAGGLYMLWMPLGLAITGKKGTALLISLIQAVVLMISGAPGSHGIWTFLTYLAPAAAVEAAFFIKGKKPNILHFVLAALFANIVGTFGSNLLFFRMSVLPLLFTLVAAAFSGAVGGVIAYFTFQKIEKTGLIIKMQPRSAQPKPIEQPIQTEQPKETEQPTQPKQFEQIVSAQNEKD